MGAVIANYVLRGFYFQSQNHIYEEVDTLLKPGVSSLGF